jgi:dTDP-glucose 4,6-dehydratase
MMDYWHQKRVLVTGADGFIGSHLTESLARKGADVRAFVLYNSFANWGWLNSPAPEIQSRIEIFPGDVRDPNRVRQAVEDREIVFHLASLIAIPYSYGAPDSFVQTNVCGTMNVLNACRTSAVTRLVHTSTSEVYGTAQYVPIDEKHPLQGQSPYSASKIAADVLAESYHRSFGLPVSIVRPFNTYGPRQSARAVIPTILSQLLSGANEIRLGTLSPTRDFNFVADTVSGFLAVAEAESTVGRVVNIGSGREISVGDLVTLLQEITQTKAEVVTEEVRLRPQNSEVQRLLCDNRVAKELTGWQPRYTVEDGLKITARWVAENLHVYRSKSYTI